MNLIPKYPLNVNVFIFKVKSPFFSNQNNYDASKIDYKLKSDLEAKGRNEWCILS